MKNFKSTKQKIKKLTKTELSKVKGGFKAGSDLSESVQACSSEEDGSGAEDK